LYISHQETITRRFTLWLSDLFGTPAEEPLTGKIPFITSGEVQHRVDVCMKLHPGPSNGVFVNVLACDSCTVEYFGHQSHAGASPWDGINAVDALMQGFHNVL
jgi:metal-dependent amidase/aminoacylase/carboxypeptidase family protein